MGSNHDHEEEMVLGCLKREIKKKKKMGSREGRANKSQIRVGLARLENGLNFGKKFSFRQV